MTRPIKFTNILYTLPFYSSTWNNPVLSMFYYM